MASVVVETFIVCEDSMIEYICCFVARVIVKTKPARYFHQLLNVYAIIHSVVKSYANILPCADS